MPEEQLVLFSLGNEEYAISITKVKEIIHYKGVTKLPNTPDYMEGVISLRGKIIPVIDLSMKLELPIVKNCDRRALIIEAAGCEIGVVVDEVTEVIRIKDSDIEAPPTMVNNEYIRGIGKNGSRLLILLDVDKVFAKAEIEEMQKVG